MNAATAHLNWSGVLVRSARAVVGSAAYAALPFIGAWRFDWPRGWIYAAVFVAVSVLGSVVVQLSNPRVLEARAQGLRKDTKPFDRQFYGLFVPLIVAYPLLAGVDGGRLLWAPLPEWTIAVGLVLFLGQSIVGTWALIVNVHAEGAVRIQEDRDHVVVRKGPYRVVRHPMYAGIILGLPAAALVLGSGWAFVPVALIVGLFIWRTVREDETLTQELPGYTDYARETKYRLVPGIW